MANLGFSVVLAISVCHFGSSTASETLGFSQFPNPGKEEVNARHSRYIDYNEDVDRASYNYYRPQSQWSRPRYHQEGYQYRQVKGSIPYPVRKDMASLGCRMTTQDQIPVYHHFSNPTDPRGVKPPTKHEVRDRIYGDETTSPPEELRGHRSHAQPRERWNIYGSSPTKGGHPYSLQNGSPQYSRE